MKIILTCFLVLGVSVAWAQKLELRIPSKPLKAQKAYPKLYSSKEYRFSQDSSIAYSNKDNMPILLAQSNDNMPNANFKMHQDSGSVYRMPNPMRRSRRPIKP
ncbi:hypothetical protein P1X15_26970 [Runella sp. MFBS21]|uniref:hypothetical protein n=1 Tax=Runella sp. MFBS21 TaxID=3034018 RepID=UPI0023F9DC80|nr:hypothetical protein [Runella sp. MFBS21]MDF7821295.1 hypothetical protein [Runella sp. MFBS21]